MKSTDSVIVSWDFSHGKDVGVLIVGKQEKGKVEIINAYQGEEAKEIYQKLVFPMVAVKAAERDVPMADFPLALGRDAFPVAQRHGAETYLLII